MIRFNASNMVLSDTEDDIEPQSMYKETKSRIKRSCSTPIQRGQVAIRPTIPNYLIEDEDSDDESKYGSVDRRLRSRSGHMTTGLGGSLMRRLRSQPCRRHQLKSTKEIDRTRRMEIGTPVLQSGMENLTRYNCVPIETERTKPTKQLLSQMSENTKSFDRTDSDATSGIGLEMAPNSNCSVSSESDKCSGTFQTGKDGVTMRQSQSDESGYETTSRHNRLVRCCSIYDNYNSIDNFILEEDEHSEDEENSVVLYIEDEDTIENDIQAYTADHRLNPLIKEQMKSITKMLDEVQLQLQRESNERKQELENRLAPPLPPTPPPEPIMTPTQATTQSLDELSSDENDGDDESIGSSSKYYRRHHQNHQSINRRSTTNSIRANRRRLRWQSFYNDHQPSFRSRPIQLSALSAGQVMVLRKLALMKLTTYIAKFATAKSSENVFSWSLSSIMKRMKKRQKHSKRNVFGVSLMSNVQRNGQPLPLPLQYALQYLRRTAIGNQGLFRKSGVKTRISRLRLLMETQPDDSEKIFTKDDDFSPYDIADLVKMYFRELPEPLMTQKLSQTFISIFSDLPSQYRLRAIQALILLLPDENREVLQTLLYFLSDIASRSADNQMPAENLAVCFAPSLFYLQMNQPNSQLNQSDHSAVGSRFASLRRKDKKGLNLSSSSYHVMAAPDETVYANKCLKFMINECKNLFKVPQEMIDQCRLTVMEQADDCLADEFGFNPLDSPPTLRAFVAKKIAKHTYVHQSQNEWEKHESIVPGINITSRDEEDGIPIRSYRAKFQCAESPEAMLDFVLTGRRYWDLDLIEWRKIVDLDEKSDVIHYVSQSMSPHPHRDYCLYRAWRKQPNGICHLYITSTRHEKAELIGDVRGVILVSHWTFEPIGSNHCQITHISRVDTRGRGPKWYENVCAHQLATEMKRIQEIFKDIC